MVGPNPPRGVGTARETSQSDRWDHRKAIRSRTTKPCAGAQGRWKRETRRHPRGAEAAAARVHTMDGAAEERELGPEAEEYFDEDELRVVEDDAGE